MPGLTVRNIPDHVLARVRKLSVIERRSLNNEILVLLDAGLAQEERMEHRAPSSGADVPAQVRLWETLCGAWQDERSADEISMDIVRQRTAGREVDL